MSDFLFAIPGVMELQTPESDALPKTSKLTPHTYGTTWKGIEAIGPITVNNAAPGVLAKAEIHFLHSLSDTEAALVLSSTTGAVTFDANSWLIAVPDQALDLRPGVWWWRLLTTSTADVVRAFYQGSLLVRF